LTSFRTGVAVCTYNRGHQLHEVLSAVYDTVPAGSRVSVCDDGSTDNTMEVVRDFGFNCNYIRGNNLGVGANKNRALYTLKDCDFICILEDDLVPTQKNWYETYINFVLNTNIHHLCRVQNKFVDETVPDFGAWVKDNLSVTPIYGPSPRGDLTFISNMVVRHVGAFHPEFIGVGHAHGQWSDRVVSANLVQHPNKWIDLKEVSETFRQLGDTSGGRWEKDPEETKKQVTANAALRKRLGVSPLYIAPFLP
jgi:glycosyltransferase involved in cell wall biosynthesis